MLKIYPQVQTNASNKYFFRTPRFINIGINDQTDKRELNLSCTPFPAYLHRQNRRMCISRENHMNFTWKLIRELNNKNDIHMIFLWTYTWISHEFHVKLCFTQCSHEYTCNYLNFCGIVSDQKREIKILKKS